MPNMAEAMLACARIGAVHPVAFGGFAARSLALRIDDAEPKLLICADAGIRGGKVIPYKPLVDAACAGAVSPQVHMLVVSRGVEPPYTGIEGRDLDYATLRTQCEGALVDVDGSNQRTQLTALHLWHRW
jgi:propionyl-CoA synthetase